MPDAQGLWTPTPWPSWARARRCARLPSGRSARVIRSCTRLSVWGAIPRHVRLRVRLRAWADMCALVCVRVRACVRACVHAPLLHRDAGSEGSRSSGPPLLSPAGAAFGVCRVRAASQANIWVMSWHAYCVCALSQAGIRSVCVLCHELACVVCVCCVCVCAVL